jgi:hypothetical protein
MTSQEQKDRLALVALNNLAISYAREGDYNKAGASLKYATLLTDGKGRKGEIVSLLIKGASSRSRPCDSSLSSLGQKITVFDPIRDGLESPSYPKQEFTMIQFSETGPCTNMEQENFNYIQAALLFNMGTTLLLRASKCRDQATRDVMRWRAIQALQLSLSRLTRQCICHCPCPEYRERVFITANMAIDALLLAWSISNRDDESKSRALRKLRGIKQTIQRLLDLERVFRPSQSAAAA